MEITIKCTDNFRRNHTLHGVVAQILEMAPELEPHKKKLAAMIKRLGHAEKYSVYERIQLNRDCADFGQFLDLKIQAHEKLMNAPDDEVCTNW